MDIRKSFEKERATKEFDFYLPDIRPRWGTPSDPPPPPPKKVEPLNDPPLSHAEDPYDGVFLSLESWDQILLVLRSRRNVVLQGPPGVGKSFVAERLARAFVGAAGTSAIRRVQFHPSMSYEDFVQGYRPDGKGGFDLRDGLFVRFCNVARGNPAVPHVFIIDELNRGNLARIFGELMMLIEPDKRGKDWEMPLSYAPADAALFYVPDNLHIIGLINTADRSLAMIDYALRRRFSFFTLSPAFSAPRFEEALVGRGVTKQMVARIRTKMESLNKEIVATPALGQGYAVGHSFFTDGPMEGEDEEDWFNRIIDCEIAQLLEEDRCDAPQTAAKWLELLMAD